MTVSGQQFTVYRGSAPLFVFTPTPGVDVTGWTVQMNFRLPTGATPALTKAATLSGPAAGGVWNVALTRADTLALAEGLYAFDLSRTDAGNEDVLADGIVYVKGTARDG